MGGFFSVPKPPPPPPPPPVPDTDAEDRKLRLEALNRRRRGRSGTITTSDRGLLAVSDSGGRRKTLLGE